MSTALPPLEPRASFDPFRLIGRAVLRVLREAGSISIFLAAVIRRIPGGIRRDTFVPGLYQVGVGSLPVVVVTGLFIGMVLAIQSYHQFASMHLESRLGAVITMSLVTELGPVLAATMLSGRVGSSIAAELGTMRVTEQIDGIRALGADPVQYLVVPRFMACLLLIPLLTAVADGVGTLGGWWLSCQVLGVSSHDYWMHANSMVTGYDVLGGLFKSLFFGAAIAVISCHRGFHCGSGAQGVGRAATESFVISFIVILIIDFLLGVLINSLYYAIWPGAVSLI